MKIKLFMPSIINIKGVKLSMKNSLVKERFSHYKLRIKKNWETVEANMILKHIPQGQDFIELGSCTSFLSILARKHRKTKKHVLVEANPGLIETIKENLRLNRCDDILVLNKAYSNEKKDVNFVISRKGIGSSSISKNIAGRKIKSISLRDIVEQHSFNKFNLVCDIEGSEKDLILNEINILRNYCNILIIDFEDKNNYLKANLIENGFELLEIKSSIYVFKNSEKKLKIE